MNAFELTAVAFLITFSFKVRIYIYVYIYIYIYISKQLVYKTWRFPKSFKGS